MAPLLSEVDLSDYFWLARDKLGASLSGASLIPPVVRTAIEALLSKVGRKASASIIGDLDDEEISIVTDQLTGRLQRDPEDADSMEGFLECVKVRPDLASRLLACIKLLPADKLPGFLPGKIELMTKGLSGEAAAGVVAIGAYLSENAEGEAGRAAKVKRKKKT